MKRLIFVLIYLSVILADSSTAHAADAKKYIQTSVFNGVNWKSLERINEEAAPMLKTCLVRGIYEGSYAIDPQNAYEQYGPWVSFRDLVLALDRFYAQERNRQIPVTYALVMIAKNPSGITPKPVEPASSGSGTGNTLVSLEKQ